MFGQRDAMCHACFVCLAAVTTDEGSTWRPRKACGLLRRKMEAGTKPLHWRTRRDLLVAQENVLMHEGIGAAHFIRRPSVLKEPSVCLQRLSHHNMGGVFLSPRRPPGQQRRSARIMFSE
ncbi:hypothetical protein E2C01_051115 [Portunus trituberculatus]|uniref:Uncharacterized protein n=1 Tax=Portunus trituberculatus TaxID=210409 RepID=A0A5B7GAQ9_PORTR|nr:hypothetical protein [Portunus trituberculatus]